MGESKTYGLQFGKSLKNLCLLIFIGNFVLAFEEFFKQKRRKKEENFVKNSYSKTQEKCYAHIPLDHTIKKTIYRTAIKKKYMTVSPKTIKKMRSMKDEGYTNKEIAKKCRVSIRTVGKRLGENNRAESASQNQQHATSEKPTDDLEDQLKVIELRTHIENELSGMIDYIEEDEGVLKEQLEFLQDNLEIAVDLKEVKEIGNLIDEGSEISRKFNSAVDRYGVRFKKEEEAKRRKAEEERKKAEEKRKEYDHRYNWLKKNLNEVLKDVSGILSWPLAAEEIDDIKKETLPYGKPIYRLAEPSRLAHVLGDFGIPEDHAKTIGYWWIQIYCEWD